MFHLLERVTPMSTSPHEAAVAAEQYRRRWQMLAFLGIAQLMLIIDVTVVALALPQIGSDLDLSRSALTWVVSIYALVFGGLMLLGGKAADVFGSRRIVLTGLAV